MVLERIALTVWRGSYKHRSSQPPVMLDAKNVANYRAVGAGPAGPAAAGPIFGQLTRVKMPYELWQVVQLLL